MNQQTVSIMQNLAMYEAQIREKAAGQVTEEELRDHINQTFVKEISKIEKTVYAKYKCVESEVQSAVKVHGSNPQLKSTLDSLRNLFDLVRTGASGAPTKPSEMKLAAGLDRAKVLVILKRVMDNIIVSIQEAGLQLAPDGGRMAPTQAAEFNVLFQQKTEKSAQDIAAEYGITPAVSLCRRFVVCCGMLWSVVFCVGVYCLCSVVGTESKRHFVNSIQM